MSTAKRRRPTRRLRRASRRLPISASLAPAIGRAVSQPCT